jgi:integrase/recombinase XerC
MNATGPVEAFLAHLSVERQGSAHTLDAYRRDLAALQAWADANGRVLLDLQGDDLRAFIAAEHRRGLSPKSLQRRLSACRSLYRWLLKNGQVAASPAPAIRAPKAPRKLPQVLDVDEAVQLVEVPPMRRWACATAPCWSCSIRSGLRLAELCALRWRDLDFDRGPGHACWARAASSASCRWVRMRARPCRRLARRIGGQLDASPCFPVAAATITPRAVQLRLRQLAQRQGCSSACIRTCCAIVLRQPRAGILGRPARRAGTAGPRRHRHHPDLHPPGFPAPGQGLRRAHPRAKRKSGG